jgi:hypothetical protein
LFRRNADAWGSFLELDSITSGIYGNINKSLRQLHVAVVVDADFRDDKDRFVQPNSSVTDSN